MQYHRVSPDLERRIKGCETDFSNRRCADQGNNHATSISIELGGLDYNDKRNRVLMFPCIPVDIELRHYSVEYSSAIDPDPELNLFHEATAARTASDFCNLSRRSRLTKSESSDSTTPERLSVKDFASLTKSSLRVKLTGRFLVAVSELVFMRYLRYAHYMRIHVAWSS